MTNVKYFPICYNVKFAIRHLGFMINTKTNQHVVKDYPKFHSSCPIGEFLVSETI